MASVVTYFFTCKHAHLYGWGLQEECIMRFITLRSPVISCLVKCFKWLLKLIKGQRSGKGHVNVLDQSHN